MSTSLAQVAATSARLAEVPGRGEKTALIAELLCRLPVDEIELAVAYLIGETRPAKLGVGPALVFGMQAPSASESPTLSLHDVATALERIAAIKGAGSAAERQRLLGALFVCATREEQVFLRRLLLGELRQGALEGLMLESIARAANLPSSEVRRAAMVAGGLPPVAQAAIGEGMTGLRRFSLRVFQPVSPMLAQPAEDIRTALETLGSAALEWKLDGARIQVHKAGDEVRVYTRNLNEVTGAVPEVVEAMRKVPSAALILDGETIALRPDGTPHPFQVTMRRFGRRLGIDSLRGELPLSVFFFDAMHRDGEDLIDRPAHERFGALREAVPQDMLVNRVVTKDAEAANAFLTGALAQGHEGIMAKSLEARYEAGGRGGSWLKVKQAHTLDLVILAAEWGSGRRRGWLSNLHLGARDAATGAFVMLGKTFKGLTDRMLAWQTEQLLALEVAREGHIVRVRHELVVEIAVNDIQASPHYPAGMALRFARVKRYRPDKVPGEADTLDTVRALFALQASRAPL